MLKARRGKFFGVFWLLLAFRSTLSESDSALRIELLDRREDQDCVFGHAPGCRSICQKAKHRGLARFQFRLDIIPPRQQPGNLNALDGYRLRLVEDREFRSNIERDPAVALHRGQHIQFRAVT